jgi:hypothetical protein
MENSKRIIIETVVKYTTEKGLDINKASLKDNEDKNNVILGISIVNALTPMLAHVYDVDTDAIDRDLLSPLPVELVDDLETIARCAFKTKDMSALPSHISSIEGLGGDDAEAVHKLTIDIVTSLKRAMEESEPTIVETYRQMGTLLAERIKDGNEKAINAFVEGLDSVSLDGGQLVIGIAFHKEAVQPDVGMASGSFSLVSSLLVNTVDAAVKMAREEGVDANRLATIMVGQFASLVSALCDVKIDFDSMKRVNKNVKKETDKLGITTRNK